MNDKEIRVAAMHILLEAPPAHDDKVRALREALRLEVYIEEGRLPPAVEEEASSLRRG